MASNRSQGVPVQEIYGYFLVRQEQDPDEKDDDDSDDGDDFMDLGDFNIYSSGSVLVDAKPLKIELISFKEYNSGKEYLIQGRFPMSNPWWAARIKVRKTKQRKKYLMGYPEYEIRSDPAVHDVMAKFMGECQIHPQQFGTFLTKLDQMNLKKSLNFHNMRDMLIRFERGGGEVHIADAIRHYTQIGVGEIVKLCTESNYADFLKYLPQLLPKHFYGILLYKPDKKEDSFTDGEDQKEKEKKREKKLAEHALMREKINTTLNEDPWVFGFSCILQKRSGLSGCEAPIERFYSSGLIEKITGVENHALHVYDGLKDICRHCGHTYVPYGHLKETNRDTSERCKRFENYDFKLRINQWKTVLDFLENHSVIKRETIHGSLRVYLKKFWKAETTIAGCMKELLEKDMESPWTFDVDFDGEQFKSLKDDCYQQEAARMISQHPLVCINGKGGCGKTTVVSAAFKHLESLLENEKTKDDWNDSEEDKLLTQASEVMEDTYFSQTPTKSNQDTSSDTSFFSPMSSRNNRTFDLDNLSFDHQNESHQDPEISPGKKNTGTPEKSNIFPDKNVQETVEGKQEEIKNMKEPIILLTAPTGKAANLIGGRAKLPAFTLHSVVMSYWNWKKGKSVDEEGKPVEWRFRKVQALVVDECSLVSVSIFSNLLKALMDEAQLKKLVLLGDVHQLPSIDPGNFLNDVFKSLGKMGLSVLLLKNHRSDADLIVANANRIQQKKLPDIDPARNFYQFNIEDDFDRDKVIKQLLVMKKPDLGGDRTSQFVAFRNSDCDAINEMCCWYYAKHGTKKSDKKRHFEVGDKICCTKNATVADYNSPVKTKRKGGKAKEAEQTAVHNLTCEDSSMLPQNQEAEEEEEELIDGHKSVKLCNGEIFFIKHKIEEIANDGKKTEYLVLETDDKKKEIKVDFRHLKLHCKLRHAWARTIHTYQGSESDTVIYVVGSPVNQTWQHVYTAVTRGKKQVVIVTKPENLRDAVSKSPWPARKTSLGERLERIDIKLWPSHRSADDPQLSGEQTSLSQSILQPSQSQSLHRVLAEKQTWQNCSKSASGAATSRQHQKGTLFAYGLTRVPKDVHGYLQQPLGTGDEEEDWPITDSQASFNSSMWSELGEDEQEIVDEMEATYHSSVHLKPERSDNNALNKAKKNLFSNHSVNSQENLVCVQTESVHQERSLSEDDNELDSSSESLLEEKSFNSVQKNYTSPKRPLRSKKEINRLKRSKAESVPLPVTDSFESPVRRTLEDFSLKW